MFDFPNSPTLNQIITGPGGLIYTWDGMKWISNITPPQYIVSEAPSDGTYYARRSALFARQDHVHPPDTSRVALSAVQGVKAGIPTP